jgi:uncharacterized protein YggE
MDPRSTLDSLFGNMGVRIAVIGVLAILALFLCAMTIKEVQDFGSIDLGTTATITVTGTGKASAVPNIAHISFTVQENATTVAAAQDSATKRTDNALAALKKLGIADIDVKTDGYNVNPQYETKPCLPGGACPQSNTVTGYQVSQSIEVKVRDTSKAGAVLQALGTLGVQNISGPNFQVDDDSAVTNEARGKAIEDARMNAEVLARQLGVRLGKVVSFSENSSMPYPMYAAVGKAANLDARAATPPTLPTGENESMASVSVTYEIR